MSRTLGQILVIAAAVAVQVIPGVGQAIGATLVTAVTSAGIAAGISLGSSLLFSSSPPKPQTTEGELKSPIPARVRGYGRRRLWGSSILYRTALNGTTVDVWAYHDGRIGGVHAVYLNDDRVTIAGNTVQTGSDKRYQSGLVKAGYTLGQTPGTAFAPVVAALPGVWTNDHRGDGVVTGYLLKAPEKDKYFLETYPQGDAVAMSLVMDLAPVFDFRDPAQDASDPATWVYKDNAALGLLHYFMTDRGVDFDTQILPEIDFWTAAADDCDAAEALDAGGTEPRYRTAVVYKATDAPAAVTAELLKPFDGWYCINERGEYRVYSGRYYEPTVTIGAAQIVSYRHQAFVEDEDAVNEVTIQYVSDQHEWNTIDAQPWRDEAAIAASGREPVTASLDAQIPSATQGRRLAKRKMLRANAAHRGTVTTTFAGRAVIGERYILLELDESSFSGAVEILELSKDMTTGGVTFDWVSVDADPDEWDPPVDDGFDPPVVVDPSPDTLPRPTITAVDPVESEGDEIQVGYSLEITATGPNRSDLTWFVRLLVAGAYGPAQSYPDEDPGASVTLQTVAVPSNTAIGVEVAYRVGDGRWSDWSLTYDVTIDDEIEDGLAINDETKFYVLAGTAVQRVLAPDVAAYFASELGESFVRLNPPPGTTQTIASALTVSGLLTASAGLDLTGTLAVNGAITATSGINAASITTDGDANIGGDVSAASVTAPHIDGDNLARFGSGGSATGEEVDGYVTITIDGESYNVATIA